MNKLLTVLGVLCFVVVALAIYNSIDKSVQISSVSVTPSPEQQIPTNSEPVRVSVQFTTAVQ